MSKKNRKLFSFANFEMFEKLVKDQAAVKESTESAVVEALVFDSLFPQNLAARVHVKGYLYSKDGNVKSFLAKIFAYNAEGINRCSRYDNFYELVIFAENQASFCDVPLSGNESELYHLRLQLDSIADYLSHVNESDSQWARDLLNELKEVPQNVKLVNIYQLLLHNWDRLKGSTRTYRLLADLVSLQNEWIDTAQTRTELLDIVNDISKEWKK